MHEIDPQTELPTDADAALVVSAQRGDVAAFETLVRRHQHRVLGVVGRYINDWSESQDIAQEVFVRVYRNLGNFRADSQFATWLHRIAVNTALNYLDARKRRPPSTDVDMQDAELFEQNAGLLSSASPEQELLRQEVETTVMDAVGSLPEDLRTAITLREVDGLSYEQIAEQMGTPVGTVRSRIFRARTAIAERLAALDAGSKK